MNNKHIILVSSDKGGTGKSVLLKHIIGLVKPDSGQILINGEPIDHLETTKLRSFQKNLSYMFQDNALFDFLNVFNFSSKKNVCPFLLC